MTYFKRGEFHGRFKQTEPKWHILESNEGWRFVAICGFEYKNTLLDAKVSRAKRGPKKSDMCSRCLARQEAVSR